MDPRWPHHSPLRVAPQRQSTRPGQRSDHLGATATIPSWWPARSSPGTIWAAHSASSPDVIACMLDAALVRQSEFGPRFAPTSGVTAPRRPDQGPPKLMHLRSWASDSGASWAGLVQVQCVAPVAARKLRSFRAADGRPAHETPAGDHTRWRGNRRCCAGDARGDSSRTLVTALPLTAVTALVANAGSGQLSGVRSTVPGRVSAGGYPRTSAGASHGGSCTWRGTRSEYQPGNQGTSCPSLPRFTLGGT